MLTDTSRSEMMLGWRPSLHEHQARWNYTSKRGKRWLELCKMAFVAAALHPPVETVELMVAAGGDVEGRHSPAHEAYLSQRMHAVGARLAHGLQGTASIKLQ